MVTDTTIKKGYKQTELRVIPDDWNIEKLPKVCWFQEGPGLRNWQFTNSGIKVINVTNLESGYLNLERTSRYISIEEFQRMYQHFEVDDKDIVVASSGNSYAKVAVVRNQDLPLVMNTSVIRFKPLKNLDYSFLLTFLKSNYFKDQIDLLITGGAQPNFGPFHLKQINIIIPSNKSEQSAIATVLSDTDALIECLEKLIAKKKAIKQGAMQQLLTGKKRLPGFSGEWEVKKLGEIVDFSNGKAHENFISDDGDYIVVNSKFISSEGQVIKYSKQCFCPAPANSILLVMSDVPNGKAIAKCFLVDKMTNIQLINEFVL
jgi:type I restriction enzyme S subunit